jgi:hypothetical protein
VQLYLLDRWNRMDREDFFVFFEAFAARTLGLETQIEGGDVLLGPPPAEVTRMDDWERSEAQRRHQVFTMLRHLDARRNQLEAELLDALARETTADARPIATIEQQLDELRRVRHGFEQELLRKSNEQRAGAERNAVFVSSTSIDLQEHRHAVRSAIDGLHLKFVGMEEFAPTETAPADFIQRKVREADVYLGILGMRYGHVDEGTGLSMTELEYRQAVASAKPLCMFVMDRDASIRPSMVEDDAVRYGKLLDFRSRVMNAHTCALFKDPADLAKKAATSLREIMPVA